MKIISRAAAVTVSATAALAFMAPAADAASAGVLRVCVFGLDDDDEAGLDITGTGSWSGEINGCRSFRAPRGLYTVDIDAPDDYDIDGGDDDRTVRVYSGERTTVKFWLDDEDEDDDDDDGDADVLGDEWVHDDDDDDDDDVTFVRADEDGDCPDGYDHSRVDDDICVRG
jgi:hypothetical protein